MQDEMTFDEWFELFMDELKDRGYDGPVDKYTFEADYEDGQTPEYAAETFLKEMLQ